jgi:hypothetical protein
MSDFEAIIEAYERSGGDPELLQNQRVASLVVSGNEVIGSNEIEGISLRSEQLEDGIKAQVLVEPGTQIDLPVHLCFGVLPERGIQRIVVEFEIGDEARVEFLAHCTFPNAVEVQHIMDGTIHVGRKARMRYSETHYHGTGGGVEVLPKAAIKVGKGGYYYSGFTLSKGRAGRVEFDYEVDVDEDGVAELDAKVMGYEDDTITIKETIRLNGKRARGLAKSRIALRDRAKGEVIGTTEGNAAGARGHVDCVEIVRDQAIANAIPIVRVSDDEAHVTHEAAIGTVDKKELETLMARGLEEEVAVDVIVRGMLSE